jgi:hypothetical protein
MYKKGNYRIKKWFVYKKDFYQGEVNSSNQPHGRGVTVKGGNFILIGYKIKGVA